jgi:hypothetical protein
MLLAIMATGMMASTLLARQHAMEKRIGVDPDECCVPGIKAATHAPAPSGRLGQPAP